MTVHEAIANVMRAAGPIAKDRQNVKQGYAFRGIDDFYATFQPLFAIHGVFMVPEVLSHHAEEVSTKGGGTMRYVTLTVAYKVYGPEGDYIEATVVGEAMDSGDKAANKAMSAAQKYLFMQLFCPPTQSSDDSEYETHELAARPTPPVRVPASKERVAEVTELGKQAGLVGWVKDQGFSWPWSEEACNAIERKAADVFEEEHTGAAVQEDDMTVPALAIGDGV